MLLYAGILSLSTIGMFQLDADVSKVILSLLNILLIVVPLISVVFTTIHFYNSYEFIELMLAQPVDRSTVFWAQYLAVALSLSMSFVVGVGIPMLIYGAASGAIMLLYTGVLLTLVFVSIAFLSAVFTRDKAKAIGIALMSWFYFVLIYDAFILWVIYTFGDYPLETATLVMVSFNPVDLARIIMILQLDISALMGYTGAFFRDFFGSGSGLLFSTTLLLVWIATPVVFALRIFKRKDL